ncbi:MAG: DUF2764 domain-containing protein [Treponemataceae bacterium]|nr:DUF2764 domain-containing protein [Treponemataceae bacterium]
MKEHYYLISQLPDLSAASEKAALPITESYYRDVCSRFLDKAQAAVLDSLSLEPPKTKTATGSAFLDDWYEQERCLRYALAQVRAQKMKKDAGPVPVSCTADVVQAARTAVGMSSPLAAEQFLYEYRLGVLNRLQPLDSFSIDAVYAYGIRLLLVQRMRKFDKEKGSDSYHAIYDTILGETI